MGKLVKYTIFLTALSASVFSSPHEMYYEKVISDGENIVHVEPILDSQNELSGFVYTDSTSNKIYIEQFKSDSIISIEVPTPLHSLVRYSELKDTLYIYTLGRQNFYKTEITLTTYYEQTYFQETIGIFLNPSPSLSLYSTVFLNHIGFRFYPDNKNPKQLIFEYSYRTDNEVFSLGDESYDLPTSLVYNLDLSEVLVRSMQTNLYPSHLFSLESMNYVFLDNYYYSYDFREPNDTNSYGTTSYQQLSIIDNFENINSQMTTSYDNIYSIIVNNFAPSSQTDELIIHANSEDFLGNYSKAEHIACYSFANGFPREIWYNNEIAGLQFEYVFKTKDMLVGTFGTNDIVMLNYLNGKVTDTSYIESSLSHIEFFETGIHQPILNLVGMSGDTVKSYRFDITTDISTRTIQEELPSTFTLLQNHPNPFNGETRFEFSNTESQFLKLRIFNILGHEIKTLAATKFTPGTYSYYWNGDNDEGVSQSTGIYFARLESAISSEMIKLIYLK